MCELLVGGMRTPEDVYTFRSKRGQEAILTRSKCGLHVRRSALGAIVVVIISDAGTCVKLGYKSYRGLPGRRRAAKSEK